MHTDMICDAPRVTLSSEVRDADETTTFRNLVSDQWHAYGSTHMY